MNGRFEARAAMAACGRNHQLTGAGSMTAIAAEQSFIAGKRQPDPQQTYARLESGPSSWHWRFLYELMPGTRRALIDDTV
jgi:hypothetical protein